MTTNVSTANLMYSQVPNGLSMSNDYFGSQVFGSNPYAYQTQQSVFTEAPNDLASALVQQHAQASGRVPSAPTMQDYMYATQIANMYSNQIPLMNPYTSFSQTDIFAQQAMPNLFCNGQYLA